jgi:hypothetical protein
MWAISICKLVTEFLGLMVYNSENIDPQLIVPNPNPNGYLERIKNLNMNTASKKIPLKINQQQTLV